MVSLFSKLKKLSDRKKQTLRSICAGLVFFAILYVVTVFFGETLCPIKRVFDISCFGCGMSRGFVAILHLDFKTAFMSNVLSVPLFFGIVLYCGVFLVDLIFDKNYLEKVETVMAKKYMFAIYVIVLIVATVLNNIV